MKRDYLLALGIPTIFIPGLILAAVLGWNWQNDLGKIRDVEQFRESKIVFPDKGRVSEVYDGDTFLLQSGQTIRLLGINAPDRGEADYEKAGEFIK